MDVTANEIERVRAFNRFYTRVIGLLDEGLHRSAYSLTEARVLFELSQSTTLTSADLVRGLGLDAGYLSRILKRFEAQGLLIRQTSKVDAREATLKLTETGQEAYRPLARASSQAVSDLMAQLSPLKRNALLTAMDVVETTLNGPGAKRQIELRALRPGDIGWVAHRQALLYHREYGWDGTYEALVSEILAKFVQSFDAANEAAWIAEYQGSIVGSVFLVRKSETVAQLRLLYVESIMRGHGLGTRLIEACINFARERGYRQLTLWTNDILVAARRLYQAHGFELVAQEPHFSFGHQLMGQTWTLDLTAER